MVNKAYLMKLGWGLISQKDALWAQVLCYKYGCGNLMIPVMKSGSQISHLWRGILQQWPMVEKAYCGL